MRIEPMEYDDAYPDRLRVSELEAGQPVSLLVRTDGDDYRAFRMSVRIEQLSRHLGEASFKTIMLNPDLQAVGKRINSIMDTDSNWLSTRLKLTVNGKMVATPRGFIAPYDSGEIDMFLLSSSALELTQ